MKTVKNIFKETNRIDWNAFYEAFYDDFNDHFGEFARGERKFGIKVTPILKKDKLSDIRLDINTEQLSTGDLHSLSAKIKWLGELVDSYKPLTLLDIE